MFEGTTIGADGIRYPTGTEPTDPALYRRASTGVFGVPGAGKVPVWDPVDARPEWGDGGGGGSTAALQPVVVFEGDSMTAGLSVPTRNATYPALVTDGLAGVTVYNFGVGGQTVAAMITDAATQVDPLFTSTRLSVVCLLGGTNDLRNAAASPATTYTRIVNYCQARRAAGWKVIVGTLLPRSAADAGASFEADRLTVNTSIRTNWASFADAIADVGNDPVLGLAATVNDTAYYGDGTHPAALGNSILAGYYRAALASFGAVVTTPFVQSLWIPAADFGALSGGATYGAISTYSEGVLYPAAGVAIAVAPVVFPPAAAAWRTATIRAFWTLTAAGAGTVIWRVDQNRLFDASSVAVFVNGTQTGGITAPAAGIVKMSNITNPTAQPLDSGPPCLLRVVRNGGTSTAVAGLLGLLIERVT